jgi:hypothetical protein
MKYKTVHAENLLDLEILMNQLAEEGYRLHSWKRAESNIEDYRYIAIMALHK